MAVKGKKEERMESRLPAEAKRQIEYAAELQGRSLSDFVVAAALGEASRIIEQQRVIRLSIDDSIALNEARRSQIRMRKPLRVGTKRRWAVRARKRQAFLQKLAHHPASTLCS